MLIGVMYSLKMARSDEELALIRAIVQGWEKTRLWTSEEWQLASEIKSRLLSDGKRSWEEETLWDDT
jgi:hypothetical protein